MGPLPPVSDAALFKKVLSLVPKRHREDALQEAWIAHLTPGGDAIQAIKTYGVRELRNERRRVPIEYADDDCAHICTDDDGTVYTLVSPEIAPPTEIAKLKISAPQQTNSSAGSIRRNSLGRAG